MFLISIACWPPDRVSYKHTALPWNWGYCVSGIHCSIASCLSLPPPDIASMNSLKDRPHYSCLHVGIVLTLHWADSTGIMNSLRALNDPTLWSGHTKTLALLWESLHVVSVQIHFYIVRPCSMCVSGRSKFSLIV